MITTDEQDTTNSGTETDVTIEPFNHSTPRPSCLDLNNPDCISIPAAPFAAPDPALQPFTHSTLPPALAPLKQLAGESPAAFSAFFLYATSTPTPNISAFAREHGFSRNTILRYRERFHWDERVNAFYAVRAERLLEAREKPCVPSPASTLATPASPLTSASVDFRAETLRLARRAIDTWFGNNDEPITLQGLTRILELASKFNPLETAADLRGKAAYERFLADLDRAYGDPEPGAEQGKMGQNRATAEQSETLHQSAPI